MKKYECSICGEPCILLVPIDADKPSKCPFDGCTDVCWEEGDVCWEAMD